MRPVTGSNPQLLLGDDRTGYFGVAVSFVYLAPVGQKRVEHLPAPRQPVRHTGRGMIEHEQLQFLADLLVIAFEGFLDELLVGFESCLVRESVGVNSHKSVSLFISAPVRAGNASYLECSSHELLRVVNVRASAKVNVIVAGIVHRDSLVVREIVYDLGLELLRREHLSGIRL